MTQEIALTALAALGLSDAPVHEPVHAGPRQSLVVITQRLASQYHVPRYMTTTSTPPPSPCYTLTFRVGSPQLAETTDFAHPTISALSTSTPRRTDSRSTCQRIVHRSNAPGSTTRPDRRRSCSLAAVSVPIDLTLGRRTQQARDRCRLLPDLSVEDIVADERRQTTQTIAWFWDLYRRGLLELDPPYQRRSVWTQAYKDYFIDTILLGYPAPAVFLFEDISEDGITRYSVVDGQQRLTTIFQFLGSQYPVSDQASIA
jgi:Protein of unknown function DUF262